MNLRSCRFMSNGLALHYRRAGPDDAGPSIIGVHGFMDHGGTFAHLAPRLAASRSLVLLDRRGYGDSEQIQKGRYDFFDNLIDLHMLLRHLDTPRCVLMGHSIGGLIALIYASAFPDQVERLVIIEPFPIHTDPDESPERVRSWVETRCQEPRPARRYPSVTAARDRLAQAHPAIPTAVLEQWARLGIRAHDDGTSSFKADPSHRGKEPMIFRDDLVRAHARKLTMPCLAVRGRDSVVKAFPDWLDELPNMETLDIEGGGHMVHLERGEAFLDGLIPFLGM